MSLASGLEFGIWNDATVQTGVPMPKNDEIIMTHGRLP